MHADGTWDNGADRGLVLGPGDSVAVAPLQLGPDEAAAVAARARAAFVRTTAALGLPVPPASPAWHWEQAALDALPFRTSGRSSAWSRSNRRTCSPAGAAPEPPTSPVVTVREGGT
jgi:hypothetical protein